MPVMETISAAMVASDLIAAAAMRASGVVTERVSVERATVSELIPSCFDRKAELVIPNTDDRKVDSKTTSELLNHIFLC